MGTVEKIKDFLSPVQKILENPQEKKSEQVIEKATQRQLKDDAILEVLYIYNRQGQLIKSVPQRIDRLV